MTEQRKNVLLVSFDDCISYWDQKTAYNEPLQTPNLDRICDQASVFRSAYCQAPICGPSRSSMLSGKAPHQTGIFDNNVALFDRVQPQEVWPATFKQNGYYCSSGGKVYHSNNGMLKGPIHRQLYSDRRKRFDGDMRIPKHLEIKSFGGHRKGWATTDPKDDVTYYDHQAANSAIDFLQNYEGNAPFYREVGFYSPHGPHVTPARFKEMYDVNNFEMPPEWQDGFDHNDYAAEHMPENPLLKKGDKEWWRCSVRNYFSALSHGDFHLGRVWEALQASAHANNTIVVILSDHGFHLGNRNLYRKTTLWEQVARVPLIIYDPDAKQGQSIHDPVALLDVGPTILDLVDLPAPDADLPGRSLKPMLAGATEADRAVPTFYHDNASIRKGDYRFIRYEDGSTQLYDIHQDYWQQHDLGPSHPAYAPMSAALEECCRSHGFEFNATT
ncbi:sulfatase-like hydrolase/transferase [uncultured Shimia sp.]|uniref:sulfatase-like hydrolase/transferase n=1 Tax=uncultured Shimia sp. TaxID=573152 RepID=UPI002614A097|nr:sulfatase-like hydrolase/transferase [uncultured Shimia sp.]